MPRVTGTTGSGAARHAALNATAWPFVAAGPATPPRVAELRLRDAAERAARRPQGRVAVVLHLSRLRPPAPRPHHRRVARAILQEAAQLHEGEVFALGNADVVLICRSAPFCGSAPSGAGVAHVPAPAALPDVLTRLLHRDATDPAALVSLWPLDEAGRALCDYAAARLAESAAAPEPPPAPPAITPAAIDAMAAVLRQGPITGLMHRQTAIVRDGATLRPLFREVGFSIPALAARAGAHDTADFDPYLFRHLARRLARHTLAALVEAFGTGGPLDASAGMAPPLHVGLDLATLLSAEFGAFAQRCRDAACPLGVQVALAEACADPAAFTRAQARAAGLGCTLVLDGVSHLALVLTRPWMLRADLLRLDWSPLLEGLAPAEQAELAAAMQAAGPPRLVLDRADTEAAVRWGVAHGIRRFQGQHVEAMLAAARLLCCPSAADCTLAQCATRASASGRSGRRFCRRPDLLDAGAPPAFADGQP